MFGELSKEQIEVVLRKQLLGRIGCHADGLTYVVPIGYAYDGEYIYGHTGEGMKIDMMRKNPRVCFQVDNVQNIVNWQSVIIQGEYQELKELQERNNALQKLLSRDLPMITSESVEPAPDWPFPPEDLESIRGIVYRIKILDITGRFESATSGFFPR
jgi:nitroimidazol reductase NimA-like FMN-containing flavoprotein (pyridoxamine 5'-phosphate oxidase superfamily)